MVPASRTRSLTDADSEQQRPGCPGPATAPQAAGTSQCAEINGEQLSKSEGKTDSKCLKYDFI